MRLIYCYSRAIGLSRISPKICPDGGIYFYPPGCSVHIPAG
ncbi:hypothetical protein AVDCRST_MAG84-4140 [uncultured Microcoleus sp.]|uniref:Uncharacterized protein n=1 Tax=uncultured Microcoleus sp. TaxID=259945 RepID=A0A6J4MUG2_9CYAN|nr:hypothetical protein AVDCRST_MAG84-4140 [uncultured Microcoleus sp.]